MGGGVKRVWLVVCSLLAALVLTGTAAAQTPEYVIFDGSVFDAQGQPGVGRVVIVFMNGREVGRDEADCDARACHFEIVVADEAGVGQRDRDGLTYVHVNDLYVGKPQVFVGPHPPQFQRANYAVMALTQTVDELPEQIKQGRVALFPDGGLVVFEPTRPPALPRPVAQTSVITANTAAFPWLAVGLLVLTCAGSLFTLLALGGLALFVAWRGRRVAPNTDPKGFRNL